MSINHIDCPYRCLKSL